MVGPTSRSSGVPTATSPGLRTSRSEVPNKGHLPEQIPERHHPEVVAQGDCSLGAAGQQGEASSGLRLPGPEPRQVSLRPPAGFLHLEGQRSPPLLENEVDLVAAAEVPEVSLSPLTAGRGSDLSHAG